MPGIKPIAAKAEGKASAPAPMTVLARLVTEDRTVACPSYLTGGLSVSSSSSSLMDSARRRGRAGELVLPYDMVEVIELLRRWAEVRLEELAVGYPGG